MLRAKEDPIGPRSAIDPDQRRRRPRSRGTDDDMSIRHGCADGTPRSVDDAIAEMRATGHDFCLFVEAGRGADSVVRRIGGRMLELVQIDGKAELVVPGVEPFTARADAPLRLDLTGAWSLMQAAALPFLFYVDSAHGRGTVLYRRPTARGEQRLGLLDLGDVEVDMSHHLLAGLL